MSPKTTRWSYAIAGWSGFYVMLVELLSGRLIAPSFGSSIYVWGSVIFTFMLGLSIGYLLGGIYSRHSPSLSRLCGILAAAAMATLPVLFLGPWVLNQVFYRVTDPRYGSLIACTGLFLAPTVFAGMVSPYAIRLLVTNTESSGRDAGMLYFVSTLGSSLGTLVTAFYLVLWLEVNTILMVAIGISLAVAGLGTLFDFRGHDA